MYVFWSEKNVLFLGLKKRLKPQGSNFRLLLFFCFLITYKYTFFRTNFRALQLTGYNA